jgi:O-antigen/teichoic acid export membrane protein
MPLFLIIIARKLGTEGFGKFSFAFSLASIFLVLGDMGLTKLVVRELAPRREQASKYMGNLLLLRLATGALGIAAIWVVLVLAGKTGDTGMALFLIGLSLILFTGLRRFFDAIFQAFEEMRYQAYMDLVDIFLTFGVGVAAVYAGLGLHGVALAMVTGACISSGLDFIVLMRKVGRPSFSIDWPFLRKLALGAMPFAVIGLVTFLFGYANTVLVSLLKGDHQAGLFSSAHRIIWGLALIPATTMTAVFPFLSRIRKQPMERHHETIRRVIKYLACISLPFCVLLILYAPRIINLVYGQDYSGAVPALWIMALAPVFSFAYIPLVDLLNAHYRQGLNVRSILLCAALNLAVCMLLTYWLGFVGAAAAVLVAELALFGFTMFFSWRYMGCHPRLFAYWKIPAAAILAGLVLIPLRAYIPLPAGVCVFLTLYLGLLLLIRAFDDADWSMLRTLIARYRRATT